jgi:hypothetical protein
LSDINLKNVYVNLYSRAEKSNVVIKAVAPKVQKAGLNDSTFDGSVYSPSLTYYELNLDVEAKSLEEVENFMRSIEGVPSFALFSRVKGLNVSNLIESSSVASNGTQNTEIPKIIAASINMVIYIDETRFLQETAVTPN